MEGGGHIFVTKCEGINFTPKSATSFMDEHYPKRPYLLCSPCSQLFNRNRGLFAGSITAGTWSWSLDSI